MEEFLLTFLNLGCTLLIILLIVYWLLSPLITTPFLVSSNKDILKLFELSKLSKKDAVIDLGSGDGRIVLAASRVAKYAVGIEHNPFLTFFSRFMAIISANGEVKFKNKNYWNEQLSEYDVVFLYLMPKDLVDLKKKFERELSPGARIVSNKFQIKGWKPKKKEIIGKKAYYLYEFGSH